MVVTHQGYNPFLPWQKTAPSVRWGYGYLVASNRVVTTESLVRNHTFVELQKSLGGEKYASTV